MPEHCHGVLLWIGTLHRSHDDGHRRAKWDHQFLRPTCDRILGLQHVTHHHKEFMVVAPISMHEASSGHSRSVIHHATIVADMPMIIVNSNDHHACLIPFRLCPGDLTASYEFFAGIGGCASAMRHLPGHRTVAAFEIDSEVGTMHVLLHPDVPLYLHDFNDRRTWHALDPAVGLWTLTCPCQPFSKAGCGRGWKDDRSFCLVNSLILCADFPPALALIENVPDLLTEPQYYKPLLDMLTELDLQWTSGIFNAMEVIPQSRRRAFLAMTPPGSPRPTLPARPTPPSTTRLSDYGLPIDLRLPDAQPLHLTQATLNVYEDHRYMPEGARRVMTPSSTLSTVLHSYGNSIRFASKGKKVYGFYTPTSRSTTSYRHLHPAELMLAQGFPSDMAQICLLDCRRDTAHLRRWWAACGNSVPPPLISWILDHLLPHGAHRDTTTFREHSLRASCSYIRDVYAIV